MARPYDCLFKLVVVGDYDVGKQEIIRRYVDNVFVGKYVTTVAVELKVKIIDYQGKKVKLQIWDTVGNDRFRSLTTAHFRGAHGVILVYDVTNDKSFHNVREWTQQIESYASVEAVKFMVGNRYTCDDEREVTREDGEKLAQELGYKFTEVGPKSGWNVDQLFADVLNDMWVIHANRVGADGRSDLRHSSILLHESGEHHQDTGGACCT